MRREFFTVLTREEASKLAPWAAHIAAVDGGWMAFESRSDYELWASQV
jgi:hypothetical protein